MKLLLIIVGFTLRTVLGQEENAAKSTTSVIENKELLKLLDISQNLHQDFNHSVTDITCVFKSGHQGDCVRLEACYEIVKYIKALGLESRQTKYFLKSRICEISAGIVYFCCIPDIEPKRVVFDYSLIPTTDVCGQTYDDRIVLGDEITHGQHPWLVALGTLVGGKLSLSCGGTLITKKHVISASHCFGGPTHVALGEFSLEHGTEVEPPIILKIASRKSPGFSSITFRSDIELLTLEREVNFTDFISPACLPFGFENETFDNITMTVAGWGATSSDGGVTTDVPMEAQLPVVPKLECQRMYNQSERIREILESPFTDLTAMQLDETQICAGLVHQDTCQGDSGGPLLYFDDKNHFRTYLIGITSFGIGCAHPEFPGIYTFVPAHLQWILENIQE